MKRYVAKQTLWITRGALILTIVITEVRLCYFFLLTATAADGVTN
jgi:hypothetical protein